MLIGYFPIPCWIKRFGKGCEIRMKWSLRIIVPMLVLLLAALQGVFFYSFSLHEIDRRIQYEVVHDLTSSLSRLQGTLGYLFRKQDLEQVQQEITSLGEDARCVAG